MEFDLENREIPAKRSDAAEGEVDLLALIRWVWRRRLPFLAMAVLGAALAVGYSFTVTKRYTATVLLLPKIPAQQEGLFAQLANLSKVAEARERINESLYGKVLSSDLVLDRVIGRKWKTAAGDSVSLFEVFETEIAVGICRCRPGCRPGKIKSDVREGLSVQSNSSLEFQSARNFRPGRRFFACSAGSEDDQKSNG